MTCRICLEDGDLIQPCHCSGTAAHVHKECLMKWLKVSDRTDCEICKYEYPYFEVEEERRIQCPVCHVSDDRNVSMFVFFIGVIGLFSMIVLATYWNDTMEDLFMYTNIMQLLLLALLSDKIHPRETYVFWKCCSTLGFVLVSFIYDAWSFTLIEATATFVLGVVTLIHLIFKQSKQMVRHINIDVDNRNETV